MTADEPPDEKRRLMFIVATEGKTREQMKADARQALANFQQSRAHDGGTSG